MQIQSTSKLEDTGIRREPTEREKVEMEMKKWAKKVIKRNILFNRHRRLII